MARTLRLKLDLLAPPGDALRDGVTNAAPAFWRANAVDIDLGIFAGDTPAEPELATGAKLSIRRSQTTASALAGKSTATMAGVDDAADWDAGLAASATIAFSDAEMNFSLAGAPRVLLWLVVTVDLAGGGTRSWAGPCMMHEDNSAVAAPPPEWPGAGITQAAADERYANLEATTAALAARPTQSELTEQFYSIEQDYLAAIAAEAGAREAADNTLTSGVAALESRAGAIEDSLLEEAGLRDQGDMANADAIAAEAAARTALDQAIAAVVDYETGAIRMWNTTLNAWVRMSCVGNPPQLELEILPA